MFTVLPLILELRTVFDICLLFVTDCMRCSAEWRHVDSRFSLHMDLGFAISNIMPLCLFDIYIQCRGNEKLALIASVSILSVNYQEVDCSDHLLGLIGT